MSIKRPWESSSQDDWPTNTYASAYSSMNAPINPSPLHYSYDSSSGAGPSRGRGNSKDNGSVERDSDEEDDDDDEDDDGKPSDPKKIKLGKDGKAKTKLTRGSRWVLLLFIVCREAARAHGVFKTPAVRQ